MYNREDGKLYRIILFDSFVVNTYNNDFETKRFVVFRGRTVCREMKSRNALKFGKRFDPKIIYHYLGLVYRVIPIMVTQIVDTIIL